MILDRPSVYGLTLRLVQGGCAGGGSDVELEEHDFCS